MPVIEDFLVNLAAGLAQTLLQRLAEAARRDPRQHALRQAYQAGFETMLRTAGSGLSQAELGQVATAFDRFMAAPQVAQALLDIALAGAAPEAEVLERQWKAIDGPGLVQNIRFDFGTGMLAFQHGLADALVAEASRNDSPLANQVILSHLVALQRQVDQVTKVLERQEQSQPTAPPQLPPSVPTPSPPLPPSPFYSCFISYSSKDYTFVERLYEDLVERGVSCWFAPMDMAIGAKIRQAIDNAIKRQDKLLVVLSKYAIASGWVEKEVETAFDREYRQKTLILFPIRLDDAVMDTEEAWAADIRRMRHIGDFREWQDQKRYDSGLARLLRDLGMEGTTPQ